ncbi:MAG: hypothetical protein H0X44_04940 [Acidobacteria bacterium]|nr:hypothetical protein [Acidobacteriota bacterium]
MLCNFEGAEAYGRALRVADLFLGDALLRESHAGPVVSLPESALSRFIGEYRHPTVPEQRLHIEVRGGVLGAVVAGTFYPAEPTGPLTFRDGPLTFEFSEPVAGTPTSLTFERPGMSGTLIQWVEPPWRPDPTELAGLVGTYRSEELDVEWTIALRGEQTGTAAAAIPGAPARAWGPRGAALRGSVRGRAAYRRSDLSA